MRVHNSYKLDACVGVSDTRPALPHVHLDVDKKRLWATNGSALVIVPCEPEEGDTSGPITVEAFKAARKAGQRQKSTTLGANGSLVVPGGATYARPVIEGLPIDRVVPKDMDHGSADTITMGLDVQILADVAKALGTDRVNLTIRLPLDEDGRPDPRGAMLAAVLVRPRGYLGFNKEREGFAVVMPLNRGCE